MKFKDEKELATFVKNLGGCLYLVGGSVRDEVMGLDPSDSDYMIVGLNPTTAELYFGKSVGRAFGVFLVTVNDSICEVALARKETKTHPGHKGFDIYSDETVTLEDDLSRRDFTMNAMAKNVLTGEISDPFSGAEDLSWNIIRHTSLAFKEDPLRVFRAARFAAKFGMSIAPETLELMSSMKDDITSLSGERVWHETEKALQSQLPSAYFRILDSVGALDYWFAELVALKVSDLHDGTSFSHVMNILHKGQTLKHRFGLLVHDLGKGLTPENELPRHLGHDKLGEQLVLSMCKRLRVPKYLMDFGVKCATQHMRLKRLDLMRDSRVLRLVYQLEKDIFDLLEVSRLDSDSRSDIDFFNFKRIIQTAIDARGIISGQVLLAEGKTPGPKFGEALFQRRLSLFRLIRKGM